MKEEKQKQININFQGIALGLIPFLLLAIVYFVSRPVIQVSSVALLTCLVFGMSTLVTFLVSYEFDKNMKLMYGQLVVTIIALVVWCSGIVGTKPFQWRTFASNIQVKEVDTAVEDLPSFEEVAHVSLMDTESARKLGDRTMGGLKEYVSQYNVSDTYTTISYKGRVVKIAPLEYAGVMKVFKNDTIPGYVIVDTLTNKAEFVEVEDGIKYSPSDMFSQDLRRHIRKEFPTELLGGYWNFQVDEDGHPYWVVAVQKYTTWQNAKVPYGAIVVDAVTGDMKKYEMSDIPEWVEQVVDGDMVSRLYNDYGKLKNGFFNFSDTGKTQVTDDYGYLERNGDIYIYTGVTSVASDESNLGFIMVNTRTFECKYYPIAGAEEYSGMAAAEGVVANYGYTASFPSLVMYGDEPTYVLVLKDDNGLVKKYAMVNMKDYTIVTVEDTLASCQKAYAKAMKTAGNKDNVNIETAIVEKVIVKDIQFITTDGETIAYVKTEDGKVFKQAFAENETLILIEVGTEVEVEYETLETITFANITIK